MNRGEVMSSKTCNRPTSDVHGRAKITDGLIGSRIPYVLSIGTKINDLG